MGEMIDNDIATHKLVQWAAPRDSIRAILLTSTRAIPNGTVDAMSDYDVILVVRDIHPFADDRAWIEDFGEVLVAYWDPVHVHTEIGYEVIGNVVQYRDGLKIDFSVWSVAAIEHFVTLGELSKELDAGYRVLLDKDALTADLMDPAYNGYTPSKPDLSSFLLNVNDFFVGVPYVAKCLLRDEILPAKWCLDYDMRYEYLLPMLTWRMECDHSWGVSLGSNGKGLKKRLPADIWSELEATYAGAGIEDTWESLFRVIALYRRVAREVGEHLGYTYPEEFDRRVTEYAHHMRFHKSFKPQP